jgi:hypothetical protein
MHLTDSDKSNIHAIAGWNFNSEIALPAGHKKQRNCVRRANYNQSVKLVWRSWYMDCMVGAIAAVPDRRGKTSPASGIKALAARPLR